METPIIWQLQARRDVNALAEALTHPDPEVRRKAAAALRALDTAEAVPALQAALSVEDDWSTQQAITAALESLSRENRPDDLAPQSSFDSLKARLNSPDPAEVIVACQALGEQGDRTASEALFVVFGNPARPDAVRYAAARAMIALGAPPAVVTLLAALEREEWEVRRSAAAVLGQLRATWATEGLITALDDPNEIVRRTALAALRRIGTPAALQAVHAADKRHPDSAPGESRNDS